MPNPTTAPVNGYILPYDFITHLSETGLIGRYFQTLHRLFHIVVSGVYTPDSTRALAKTIGPCEHLEEAYKYGSESLKSK